MNILMVSPLFHPYVGGAESHTRALAEGLVSLGHRVGVVTDRGYADQPRLESYRGVLIARTTRFALADPRSRETVRWEVGLFDLLSDVSDCRDLLADGWRGAVDVVHAQAQGAFVVGAVLARELSAPLVVTSHETLPFGDGLGRARSAVLYTLPDISMVVAGSEYFVAQAVASGVHPDRIRLVPYGMPVPVEPVVSVALPSATVEDPLRVVSIGRFKPRKNQRALVEAIDLLRQQDMHVQCSMIGRSDASSREYLDEVLAAVAELRLTDQVEVLSQVDDAERARRLADCHLVVQPAHHEGFGLAALEAVLAGRMVILAPNAGYVELAGADSPLLTADFSPASLADKVRDVLARPSLYRTEVDRLHARCVHRNSDRRSAEATATVYRHVLAGHSSGPGPTDRARSLEVAPRTTGGATAGPAPAGPATVSSDPRFSIVVMSHPSRRHLAERLITEHSELNMTIAFDRDPNGSPGSYRAARAAWAAVARDATHHVVLQDDVELCAGFLAALRVAVATRPGAAISLFAEWGARTSYGLRIAALLGRAWAEVTDMYVPSQALVLPAQVARSADDLLAGAEARGEPDDQALLSFLVSRSVDRYAVLPNLVQHRDVPSVVGNDAMGLRRSVCYRSGGPDPGELAQVARPDAVSGVDFVPYFSWTEASASFCVRPSDERAEWPRVPALDVFARRGLSAAHLAAAFGRLLATPAVDDELRDRISPILLRQLWLTGVALGLRVADLSGRPSLPDPLPGVADHAMSTLGPGALRRFIPPQHLERMRAALEPLVWAAVRFGVGLRPPTAPEGRRATALDVR